MAAPRLSRKKTQFFSLIMSFIILGILILTREWWPGLMLAIGLPLALRQYLLGRNYDAGISLLVFVGTFVTVKYDLSWEIFLPILFTLGSIYVFIREWTESRAETEAEREEDLNHEIEETPHPKRDKSKK